MRVLVTIERTNVPIEFTNVEEITHGCGDRDNLYLVIETDIEEISIKENKIVMVRKIIEVETEVSLDDLRTDKEALIDFLGDGQSYSIDATVNSIMGQMVPVCHSLIFEDADGALAVDFLGAGIREVWGAEVRDWVVRAYAFVRSEAARFRAARNRRLALRYHLLQQYIESRLPVWGLAPD